MNQVSRSLGLFSFEGLSPETGQRLAAISSFAGALTLVLGVAGVVGWLFDLPAMRHVFPGLPAVRPLSALCLGLLGGALWVSPSRPLLSGALALGAALAASLSVFEPLSGLEQTFRHLFIHRSLVDANPPLMEAMERTPWLSALGFVWLALAMLIGRWPALVGVAQTIGISVIFVALVPMLGFFYRIDTLSSPLLASAPSLQGSLGIALLAIGILCTHPERGAIGLLAGRTAGSRAARRLLLPALALPMLLGGVFLYARHSGAIDVDAAVPIFVCALAATLGGSVLWVARADARMEILHRRGEESLREMADASPLMMWISDANGRATHMNPPMLALTGSTMAEALGLGWHDACHPDDRALLQHETELAVREKRSFSAEFRARRADGQWRWILSTGVPRFTPTRELSGHIGSCVDVTDRKDAEQALLRFAAELEDRVAERTSALTASKEELARQSGLLESIVKSMGDAVLALSLDGRILLSNEASARLFGGLPGDADAMSGGLPGKANAMPGGLPADAEANDRSPEYGFFLSDGVTPFPTGDLPVIRALRGEYIDNVMMIAKYEYAPDGFWVRITGRPIRDHEGRTIGAIVVGRDVTEFERALEATRHLAAVVESSGDAILSVSLDGEITSWNRGAESMYGYSGDEAVGLPLCRLDPSPGVKGIENLISTLTSGAALIRRDTVGLRRDGTSVDIAATMSPIHDETGRVHAVSVVHHDITHRKEAERRIQALNDELEQRVRDRTAELLAANHDLENYASSVAHDLRTPLRAIAGFAHVLEEDYAEEVGEEGRRVIGVVRKNAQEMGGFIDALLSFSAVDRLPPNKATVDVTALVRECLDSLVEDCSDRQIDFRIEELPACHADQTSLRQIFMNLLANAIKFTRRSEHARIEVGSTTEPDGTTAYYVRDNGVGFDMSNTRRLFRIFQRLHSPREFEGTGLGLANVARIVAAHGGRVWAEAEPGRGATFRFVIDQREGGS